IKVVASFFPLYDFARNVAGDRADVSVFIPAGIEPHDWEPTPQSIAEAESADVLVYNGAGFESWIAEINSENAVDSSRDIEFLAATEEHEGEEEEHEGEELDPHVWLDPVLAKHQVNMIRDGLAKADPANAQYYADNAARYSAELDQLDAQIKSELSSCEKADFIAFHSAFSYFANRYGLTQHAIQGVAPEGEVLPQRIQEIKDLAVELGIDTIYSEELVDPRLAEVIASEIPDGRVLVLSPLEGLEEEEERNGAGYLDKMQDNLENLKVGLKCTQ
ncbi:MAG: metal ABC transporter solute-binding protein, Zn/Mn family, partial [Nitrososphaera sp.]